MNAQQCRLAATLALLCLALPAFAQSTPDTPAESAGKGTSKDGSGPADGAIKGGAIVPGERAGVPTDREQSRCADLTGTLREQCLAQEQGASGGGTRAPEPDAAKLPPVREAPPPQNSAPNR